MKKAILMTIVFLLFNNYVVKAEDNMNNESGYKKAIFAGGCFWCMESAFEKIDGVGDVISGFCGGRIEGEKPTYKKVSSGKTGYAESVLVPYDPGKVSYHDLLNVFWMNINPTQINGQFADKGYQYRTAIFYLNNEQKKLAEESRAELSRKGIFGAPIVTEITKAEKFYPAEEYHQNYYKKNPIRYKFYRAGSGRDKYIKSIWGDKTKH